jgi:hypothetical protein
MSTNNPVPFDRPHDPQQTDLSAISFRSGRRDDAVLLDDGMQEGCHTNGKGDAAVGCDCQL